MALKKFLDEVGTGYLWGKITTALAEKADASALTTLDGKVTTLIGSDTNKSVRTIANEELAAQLIPNNASEALDTLQEIAAWIQAHPGDASAMNSAISALQTKLTLGTHEVSGEQVEYATVADYVSAVAGDVHTHSNKTELDSILTGDVAKWNATSTSLGSSSDTAVATTAWGHIAALEARDTYQALTNAEIEEIVNPSSGS